MFLAVLAGYLATFEAESDGIILGNDVVPYARALVAGEPAEILNPHHLLAHPLAWLALRARGALGAGAADLRAALDAQVLVSSLGGALACAVLFGFARRRVGPLHATLLAATFACASGNWLYGAVGETYLPAIGALAALLARAVDEATGERERSPLRTGLWLLLAVLLRQDSVLVVPALLAFDARRHARAILGAGLAALALYALAWTASGSELGFVAWLRGLADTGLWGGRPDARAIGWAFGTMALALSYLPIGLLADEPAPWALLGYAPIVFLAAASLPIRPLDAALRRCVLGLALFLALRFAFFAWWQPTNMEYHTGSLLPAFLIAPLVPTRRIGTAMARVRGIALWSALAIVAAGNWIVLIQPNRGTGMHVYARDALHRSAERGGLAVALDPFQYYALVRAGADAGDAVDASPLVGLPPDELPDEGDPSPRERYRALADRVSRLRARGAPVAFVTDILLPPRLELSPWHVDPAALRGLVGDETPVLLRGEGPVAWCLLLP